MYLNWGTWHFVHDRWMFVLDKNITWHYRQYQGHHQPWHWTTANNTGQAPLHLRQAPRQPMMDGDGTFQLLREELNFMDALFQGANDGLGRIIELESSPCAVTGTTDGTCVNQVPPSLGDDETSPASCSSMVTDNPDKPLLEPTLVHSKSDEQLALQEHMPSASPYMVPSTTLPWGAGGGVLPDQFGFYEGDASAAQYAYPTGNDIGAAQPASLLPWRSVLHSRSPGDAHSTLCPAQLGPAPCPLPSSTSSCITPKDESVISLSDWECESLSAASEKHAPLPAASHHQIQTENAPDDDRSSQNHGQRQKRTSLPGSRPRVYPNEQRPATINPNTGTPYQAIYTKPPSPSQITTPSPPSPSRNPRKSFPGETSRAGSIARRIPSATGPARAARDSFLLQCRAAGMSYKQLKEYGNLPEAESTLRGRYRVLTKSKQERVRCPVWTDRDVELLKAAVEKVKRRKRQGCGGGDKLRWTDVARDIGEAGCSYPFGVMACKKKWDEVRDDDE